MKSKSPNKKDDFPIFGYDINKVLDYSRKLKGTKKQLEYLEYAKKEKLMNAKYCDQYSGKTSFETQVDIEIDFLKRKLSDRELQPQVEINQNKIVWLKNKQDLIFLFDELLRMGFIPYNKAKDKLIANHFTWYEEDMDPEKNKSIRKQLKNFESHPSDEISIVVSKMAKPKD